MTGPILSRTTTYTPPRTNIPQIPVYTARTAKLKIITASIYQAADGPMACSAMPPA